MTPQGRLLRKGDTASNNVDEVRESSSAPNFQELVTVSIWSCKAGFYMVEPSQGEGRKCVLLRNLLLGYKSQLPIWKRETTRLKQREQLEPKCDTYPTDTDSSSKDEYHVWTTA